MTRRPFRLVIASMAVFLAASAWTLCGTAFAADDEPPPPLDDAVAAMVDAALSGGDTALEADALVTASVAAHGTYEPLLVALREVHDDESLDAATRERALGVALHALHRRGSLDGALEIANRLLELGEDRDVALRRAELLDAQGKRDEAAEAYEALIAELAEAADAPKLHALLRLRLALLDEERLRGDPSSGGRRSTGMIRIVSGGRVVGGAARGRSKPPTEAATSLVTFATEEGRDDEVRRRAAILLGMLGYSAQASEVDGEPSPEAGFRETIRRAEWALASEEWATAQELAWQSLRAAELQRDRSYGLSVLVEAYRGAEDLDTLIDRLGDEDWLGVDGRSLWIDLLRETGRTEEALALFREQHAEQPDLAIRRQILEMQRQTGDVERLISSYREQIAAEPQRVEWREGLSRHFLEQGDADAAQDVWRTPPPGWSGTRRLAAAEAMFGLGLDEMAIDVAETCVREQDAHEEALLFLSRLHALRGRFENAAAALDRLDELAPEQSAIRMSLAEALEKLGRKDRAADVLARVLDARTDMRNAHDVEMHLAWLLGELGRDDEALARWKDLWGRVEAVARRRYIEQRMMTTASRLGELADIVVDLEEKLAAGEGGARESGLLVRIYTKVGDAVSAAEIIDEHLKTSGGDRLKALKEKSFVYLACTDFAHYEDTLDELIELDPENERDYLQQLAMSKLERGRHDEARKVLGRLQALPGEAKGLEFEAGVLALAGLRDEAAMAYRRGIAGRPENIDSFLLLANVLRETGSVDEAIGMFQYLVAHAPKDDLFTVAIDGLLNMEASPSVLRWARRAVHERIATREDKVYLHRLVADLSEELGDTDGMLRAIETALPIAGEQRAPFLRELMDVSMQRGLRSESLRFGRRLLASDDLVPPQVYLDLGDALLADGDVRAAEKTFSRAADIPDQESFQLKVADSFEKAGFLAEALRAYQRVLVGRSDDAGLLVKVAELFEQLGRDDRAVAIHRRAIDSLLLRRPLSIATKKDDEDEPRRNVWWAQRNVDAFDQHFPRALRGWLTTVDRATALARTRADAATVREDLATIEAEATPVDERRLEQYPRIRDRAMLVRRVAQAFGEPGIADELDVALLRALPADEKTLESYVRQRLSAGRRASAQVLLEGCGRDDDTTRTLRWLVGSGTGDTPGAVPLAEASRRVLEMWRDGDHEALRELLIRADLNESSQDALDRIPPMLWTALELRDPDLTLLYGRAWLRLAAKHTQSYQVERQADLVISRCAAVLGESELRSLAMTLVNLVREEPEKYIGLVAYLPRLQQRFDQPLLTAEQSLELVEVMAERRSWGMGELLRIIPPGETLEAVRTAVDKAPESRRALVLVQLLGGLEAPAGEQLSAYAERIFEEGIAGVKDEWWLRSLFGNTSVRHRDNLDLFARLVDVLLAQHPDVVQARGAQVTYLRALGRDDEAVEKAQELFREWLERTDNDWQWRNAAQQCQDALLPDHRDAFLAVFDDMAENRPSASIEIKRLDFLQRNAGDEEMVAAAKRAWDAFPDDTTLRDRYLRALQVLGLRREIVAVLEQASADKPRDEALVARLVSEWTRLRHAEKALEARERLEALRAENAPPEEPEETGERIPPANVNTLREALVEDEDVAAATTVFRRMWRLFDVDPRFLNRFSFNRLENLWWPVQRQQTTTRSRGGLDAFMERRTTQQSVTRRSVYEELAERGVALDEMRRIARTAAPDALRQMRNLFTGLAIAAVAEHGVEGALERTIARIASSEGDARDEALLLALLERHPEAVDESLRATLEQLTAATDPMDGQAILQLARVHARAGRAEEAERLYRWCAYLSSAAGVWGTGNLTSLDARRLVDDALDDLEGEALSNFVDTIRVCADPGPSHWGRDGFETLMLETWAKAGGAEDALRRGAEIVANVTDTEFAIKQGTAKVAARLLAEAGRHDEAIRCLEFAVTRTKPSVELLLLPAYERQRRIRGGFFNWVDVQRLFAPEMRRSGEDDESTWTPDTAWLSAGADALASWVEDDRIDEDQAFVGMALLAVRLHEAGDTERPARLRALMEQAAGDEPNAWLWLADLDRRLGDDASAHAIEDRLLAEGELYVERVPEVLERVAKTAGPAVALERGEAAFAWTAHPGFLQLMADTAAALGDDALAKTWADRKAAYEAAKAELEKEDDE